MADEALKCFTTLLESIPGWIADLEDTLQTAAKRQKEMLFENQPAQDEQPIDSCHDPPRRPSKSSSLRSKRSLVEEAEGPKANDNQASPVEIQMPHMTQSDALRLAQRKRKTASVCSDRAEGPHKYRSRSMVVIYYDGDTQKRFEEMVRAISTCRNALRKAKMNARMEIVLSKSPPHDKTDDSDNDDDIEIPTMVVRSARARQNEASSTSKDETQAFDRIDGFLEKAQMMCERAAHQILRDGDCALEIKHAQQYFADARKLGEDEKTTWQKRADEAAEKKVRDGEACEAAKETAVQPKATSSEKRLLTAADLPTPPSTLEPDIEVDDEADDDEGFTPLGGPQYTKPYFRRAGLTAH
ncbi:uncharacterized protein LTR77_009214 [Saxophila tyrrhenica]|uniref:Uncharacterized protein n=1 Tax=Saxophila tyrrhenica TaxID=1690608 RepID=A0AAV9NYF8_9PEZI|nr:hypothetical protein LTR77_009214 [Saxophila tyrrhenica]